MKSTIGYRFHHKGGPATESRAGKRYSAAAKKYTADHPGRLPSQWHRFEPESPLHLLLRPQLHVAFQMDDLEDAVRGEVVLLGPYEAIDGYRVAVIDDQGAAVELIHTDLTDAQVWDRAAQGRGPLYRDATLATSESDVHEVAL